jgi:hypothetical protein
MGLITSRQRPHLSKLLLSQPTGELLVDLRVLHCVELHLELLAVFQESSSTALRAVM